LPSVIDSVGNGGRGDGKSGRPPPGPPGARRAVSRVVTPAPREPNRLETHWVCVSGKKF